MNSDLDLAGLPSLAPDEYYLWVLVVHKSQKQYVPIVARSKIAKKVLRELGNLLSEEKNSHLDFKFEVNLVNRVHDFERTMERRRLLKTISKGEMESLNLSVVWGGTFNPLAQQAYFETKFAVIRDTKDGMRRVQSEDIEALKSSNNLKKTN